jgi:hypothetical protein
MVVQAGLPRILDHLSSGVASGARFKINFTDCNKYMYATLQEIGPE